MGREGRKHIKERLNTEPGRGIALRSSAGSRTPDKCRKSDPQLSADQATFERILEWKERKVAEIC